MHDLSASQVAQLLRLYSAKRHDPRRCGRRQITLASLARASGISRRAIYLARTGYISERTRRLLSAGISYMSKERQVRPFAHGCPIDDAAEALNGITGFRT